MTDRTCHRKSNRHGFSILELVIVLGIIALIAGAGLTMATGAIKAADRVSTQERLNTIKLALDSFAKTYGYLPCPANRAIVPTNTSFGIESRSGTACVAIATGVITTSGIWYGAVPVRTLGLPDNYAGDAWGGKLTYAVSANLAVDPSNYSTAASPFVLVRYGSTSGPILGNARNLISGGTASSNAGNVRVTFGSTTDASTGRGITTADRAYISSPTYKGSFMPNAVTGTTVDFTSIPFTNADAGAISISWLTHNGGSAYAVVSHGADGRGAFPLNGTAVPTSKACNTSAADGENCDADSTFVDGFFNDGTQVSVFYDDYIVYGSHEMNRAAFNPTLYTGTLSSCPAGTCEAWCAGCAVNYPGGGTVIPPPTITSGATLCRKIITSNATQCTASCFWGGVTAAGIARCP